MTCTPILRVARPTDNLQEITKFYCDGLGFKELLRFEQHAGFDGVMLGHPGAPYHLEFTSAHGASAGRAPCKDHLLVFYLPEETDWTEAIARFKRAGYSPVVSPYWEKLDATFEDPDGYRVVLPREVSSF
jgi:catechol 2,3-dioxygenase-like lactoylglutathione lyase family enzyme